MAINRPYHDSSSSKIKYKAIDKLEIVCDNCGSEIPSSNININNSLAKCDNCQSVYNLKEDLFFLNDKKGRPELIMPEGTDILTLNDSLDIRVDWLKSNPKSSLGFLTFFTVMWNGFLAIMAAGMIASGALSSVLFLSVHLAVGLGLIYYISSIYLNYTDIIVTSRYIEVNQRPIPNPFKPSHTYNTQNIEQLYVSKYVSSTTNNVPNIAYALNAKLKNKSTPVILIKGMNKETQLYLEQEIERYLGINDQIMPNAINK